MASASDILDTLTSAFHSPGEPPLAWMLPQTPTSAPVTTPVPVQKQIAVAAAGQQKAAALGMPTGSGMPTAADLYSIAASKANNGVGGAAITDPIQRDVLTLTTDQLLQKYGRNAIPLLANKAKAENQYEIDRRATRSTSEGAADTAISAGIGAADSVLGIGAFGLGLVDPQLGAAAGEGIQALNDFGTGNQSAGLQARHRAFNTVSDLKQADNAAQSIDDAKTEGGFVAGLTRIGKDALDTVGDTVKDPTILEDGLANAAGSILATAPVVKGLGVIGKGLSDLVPAATKAGISAAAAIDAGTGTLSAARATTAIAKVLSEHAAVPLSVGLMEGGGTYQQTVAQIMGQSHDELMAKSSEYANTYNGLVSSGMSDDDAQVEAKSRMANKAGLIAGAIQAPIAGATGLLTEKFLKNPFRAQHLLEAAATAGKEGVEETIQSGVGQLAQNVGVQQSGADPKQDLLENVGQQAGQGGLFGLGSAGVIEAPGVALKGVVATGKGIGLAAKTLYGMRMDKAGAASPITAANIDSAHAAMSTDAQDVRAEYDAAAKAKGETTAPPGGSLNGDVAGEDLSVDDTGKPSSFPASTTPTAPGQANPVHAFLDKIGFDPAEVKDEPAVVQDAVKGATNRYQALRQVADVIKNKNLSVDQLRDSFNYLNNAYADFRQTAVAGLEAAVDHVDDNDPVLPKLRAFERTVSAIEEHPVVKMALAKGEMTLVDPKIADTFSAEAMKTPEGQRSAQATADSILNLPMNTLKDVSEQTTRLIREQADGGGLTLTPQQRSILAAATSIAKETRDRVTSQKHLGLASNNDLISAQAQSDLGLDPETKGKKAPSALAHAQAVKNALEAGDLPLAKQHMQDFRQFVDHFGRKVTALNQAVSTGKRNQVFDALKPVRTLGAKETYKAKVGLTTTDENSVKNAQAIALDGKSVTNIYNGLANAFPELKAEEAPHTPFSLDPELNRKAAEIALEQRSGVKSEPSTTTEQQQKEAPAEVEPKVEPKAEPVQSRVSTEQAAKLTDAGLQDRMDALEEKRRAKKATPEDEATHQVLSTEMDAREKMAADEIAAQEKADQEAKVEPKAEPEAKSRVSEKQAANLSDKGLGERITRLTTKQEEDDLTPADKATLKVLQDEQVKREAADLEDVKANQTDQANEETQQKTDQGKTDQKTQEAQKTQETEQVESPELFRSKARTNKFESSFPKRSSEKSHLVGLGEHVTAAVTEAVTNINAFRKVVGDAITARRLTGKITDAYSRFMSLAPAMEEVLNSRLEAFLKEPYRAKDPEKLSIQEWINRGFDTDSPEGEVQTWKRGKVLNLTQVEETESGPRLVYNPELVQSAIMAGMQWLVNTNAMSSRPLDDVEVAKIFGVRVSDVTEQQRKAAMTGLTMGEAIAQLSNMIRKYWGVTPEREMQLGFTRGIPEAMAKEIFEALNSKETSAARKGNPLLEVYTINRDGKELTPAEAKALGEEKGIQKVRVSTEKTNAEILNDLAGFPTAIEHASLVDPDEIHWVDKPPTEIAEFQLRNRRVRNTKQQKQALENRQTNPHHLDEHTTTFYERAGEDGMATVLGSGDLTERQLNKNHKETLQGQDQTVRGAYRSMMALLAEVRSVAQAKNLSPFETAVYFAYNINRVGRLQMDGPNNPQMSKLAREMVLPTHVTIDLNNNDNRQKFMLGVAQAFGVKIHTKSRDASVREADRLAETETDQGGFRDAYEMMEDYLDGPKDGQIPQDQLEKLRDGFGFKPDGSPKITAVALHAMLDLVRYHQADEEGRAAFKTSVYVEADGITNGVINALVHLATGSFDPRWIQLMRKGGLFIGSRLMSMNVAVQGAGVQPGEVNSVATDLYKTAANIMSKVISTLRKTIIGDVRTQAATLDRLIKLAFPGGITVNPETGDMTIDRGITKNPLTITVYGAGINGIAGNIMGAIADAFYEELSKSASGLNNNAAEMRQLIQQLTTSRVYENPETGELVYQKRNRTKMPTDMSDIEYTLTPDQKENLQRNLLHLFVTPMHYGISTVIESTLKGRNALLSAVQVMGVLHKQAFDQVVKEKIAERKAKNGMKDSDFLSQAELDDIFTSLKDRFPFVQTGTQTFFPGGMENYNPKLAEFTRSLSNRFGTSAQIDGPGDPGVAGVAYLNIGPGDGQTMQNLFTSPDAPKGALDVYDGVHLKLTTLDEDAVAVNKAVYDSWQKSPLGSLNKAYSQFTQNLAEDTFSRMTDAELREALGAFYTPNTVDDVMAIFESPPEMPKDPQKAADLKAMLQQMRDQTINDLSRMTSNLGVQVADLSRQAEARHKTLGKVDMSVDQMAGVSRPFSPEGKISLDGLDDSQMADRLNLIYEQQLDRIEKREGVPSSREAREAAAAAAEQAATDQAKQDARNARTAPTKATREAPIDQQLAAVGKKDPASGAWIITTDKLPQLLGSLKLPAEQKNLMTEITRKLMGTAADVRLGRGWEIVIGTPEELKAHSIKEGFQPPAPKGPGGYKGYAAFDEKRLYLVKPTSETLLHELIHTQVTETILGHFRDPTKSSEDVAKSISNLQVLQTQWLNFSIRDFNRMGEMRGAAWDAYQIARDQVQRLLARRGRLADNQAAALDEFLTWNLSNQYLIKQAQQTKVENPVARVVKSVLKSMETLIWGRSNSPSVPSDMYSALRFNASVLMNAVPTLSEVGENLARLQADGYGQSDRLSEIKDGFARKLNVYLHDGVSPEDVLVGRAKLREKASRITEQVTEAVMDHGFTMNEQEKSTFQMMLTVLSTQAQMDPNVMSQMQDIYAAFTKAMPADAFQNPNAYDQENDSNIAALKRKAVLGTGIAQMTSKTAEGRSTLLPTFVALATVNDEFRQLLATMELPSSKVAPNTTFDNVLDNLAAKATDMLSRSVSGLGDQKNMGLAIDILTDRLAANNSSEQNVIDQAVNPIGRAINFVNTKTVGAIQSTIGTVVDKLEQLEAKTTNKYAQAGLAVTQNLLALGSEETAAQAGEGVISTMNQQKLWLPFQDGLNDFITDVVGRSESNANVFDLVKEIHKAVSAIRQQFKEHLPGLLNGRFKTAPTEDQYSHMYHGWARTDAAALSQSFKAADILEIFKSTKVRDQRIAELEATVKAEAHGDWSVMQAKAQQLAHFMTTGQQGDHLLRNAQAIAALPEIDGIRQSKMTAKGIAALDQLVTLYAIKQLPDKVQKTLSDMAEKEPVGSKFMLDYLVGQRKDELSKLASGNPANVNYYKGYAPTESNKGEQLIVADDAKAKDLALLGFKRIADYQGSTATVGVNKGTGSGSFGYYYSPVPSRNLFLQGLVQNIRATAYGVDPVTGFSYGPPTAGRISDPLVVKQLTRRLAAMQAQGRSQGNEPLMPIFDNKMRVTAYERATDPAIMARLETDTNLARAIGLWRGRQVEEGLARGFNNRVVNTLANMWEQGEKDGRANEFVDLFKSNDPVIKDAVALLSHDTIQLIKREFGDQFMVRRDQINNVVGYRAAGVGDSWTGTSRLPKPVQEAIRTSTIAVFGVDAYKYLTTSERILQNLVVDAKQNIIIRSVIVGAANMAGNLGQLNARGIGPVVIARKFPKKLAETQAYARRRIREIEIDAELRAAGEDLGAQRRLRAERLAITDANRRMTIWPLVEAGELSAISDAGALDKQQVNTLFNGDLTGYIESLVDRLPQSVRTAARYALITHDTALYKGMELVTEYGDFLSKAIYYDHLLEKGLTSDQALGKVTEEFVSYDHLPGRTGSYLDAIGLLWFFKYKVRIAKIALDMMRNNPVQTLLASAIPWPNFIGSVGLPTTDDFFSKAAEGKLPYSIGWGQMFHSFQMPIWENIVGTIAN